MFEKKAKKFGLQGFLLSLGLISCLLNLGLFGLIGAAPIAKANDFVAISGATGAEEGLWAIVVKRDGTDVMSDAEEGEGYRALHLPYGFIVEELAKQGTKIFVWCRELASGGWVNAPDLYNLALADAKALNRFGNFYYRGSGEKITVAPSISLATITRVLLEANSPAIKEEPDFAAYIYQRSFTYNVDPAYLLAFFMKESSYGTTGAAATTKNLGNIRCTPGYVCDGEWRKYGSWKAAAEDWYYLIASQYINKGLDTVSRIVVVYAPPSENDSLLYIAQVNSAVLLYRLKTA